MLANSSYGQDVPKPIRHQHPESGELDRRGFVDGSLRHGRMKRLARGGWGLAVLSEDMRVTAKLHSPLPGLHQDTTLAESVAFLWYLRHVSAMGGTFKRAIHLRVDLETHLRVHRRDRCTSR